MSTIICKLLRVLNGRFIRKVLAQALKRKGNHLQALITVYHKGLGIVTPLGCGVEELEADVNLAQEEDEGHSLW
ncbi:hypothetical protein Tco_0072404 [Tanacetum coccineum]